MHTVWQVKASTFCSLRCSYCYEWGRLAERRRLSIDGWRRVLEAMRDYRRIRLERHGVASRTIIVWHGGEPLLLPAAYVGEVLQLQREILGDPAGEPGYGNGVQTSLAHDNDTLEALCGSGFLFSVSFDGGSGGRIDRAGRPTGGRVLANLERLRERSIACGVALVLGRHNLEALTAVYERLEPLGLSWLRIIPLYRPPTEAPGGGLELAPDEIVASLFRLFETWMRSGRRLHVQPLARVLDAAQRSLGGTHATVRDRRQSGETRLVVHPDGTLSPQAGIAAPLSVLGNVLSESIGTIVDSPAYEASLGRDEALRERHCAGCLHNDICDTRAVFDYPHQFEAGPCPIESKLLTMVTERLRLLAVDRLRVS